MPLVSWGACVVDEDDVGISTGVVGARVVDVVGETDAVVDNGVVVVVNAELVGATDSSDSAHAPTTSGSAATARNLRTLPNLISEPVSHRPPIANNAFSAACSGPMSQ